MKQIIVTTMVVAALMVSCTSKAKNESEKEQTAMEIEKNGKFELVAVKRDFSEWIRVSGVLVDDPDVEPQKEYLKRNPQFANSYQPGDGNMAMLYVTNATARISSFTGKPERIFIF